VKRFDQLDRFGRFDQGAFSIIGATAAAWLLFASVAHACPMCFNGNGTNTNAFVVGSLFLMIVPVTAIGSLLYWAYKRSKALETPPTLPRPPARPDLKPGDPQPEPALRLVGR